jgi:hypothetical protein
VSARRHPLAWAPAFVVGVCLASVAEIAVGLLLYTGPGLVRSITTILGVEAAALSVGLWTAPGPRPDLIDALRRRWMLCLLAFLVATLFAAFWTFLQEVGGTALGQGMGLAFMAGLPLYACGGVLGGMTAANAGQPDPPPGSVGAPAFLGVAAGIVATGIFLPRVPTPASLLLVCLVLLSAGGLVFGFVLDSRLRVLVRARRPTAVGDVWVEDRHLASHDRAARLLLEGRSLRRWMTLGGENGTPWDVAAFRAFAAPPDVAFEMLLVGGGASSLPRAAVREHPSVRVSVSERSATVLELGREHMETGLSGELGDRLRLGVGNLDDLVQHPGGPYGLIVLDTGAFGVLGGLSGLSGKARDALCARLASGGTMVVGPMPPDPGSWEFPTGWRTATYRRPYPDAVEGLGFPGEGEVLLAARPAGGGPGFPEVEGFDLESAGEP